MHPRLTCYCQNIYEFSLQATPRRLSRVAKKIEEEATSLLQFDNVLQAAIEGQLSSRSPGDGAPEITVSEVELHQDLRFARIFVTIQGARTMKEKRQILRGLDSCTEYVRYTLAEHLQLRFSPEIQFRLNQDNDSAERVEQLLEQIRLEKEGLAKPERHPYFKTHS